MNRINYTKLHILGRFKPNTELTDDYEFVGTIRRLNGTLDVYVEGVNGDEFINVEVVSTYDYNRLGYKRVMEIQLSYKKNSYEVDLARIDSKFQGHGIAPHVYRFLLRKLGIVLQAGTMQSPGGRSIWCRLAEFSNISVFAMTRNGDRYDIEVDSIENEIYSDEIDIYDGKRKVRVYAYYAS